MAVENRGPQVSGVAGFFLALSTTAIVLRCYCRLVILKNFGVDDWLSLVAWVFFVLSCAFTIVSVFYGTGQHASTLSPTEIPVGLKWWWICEPVYVFSNMALKLSIAIFQLRIAVVRTHKIIIWFTVVVLELYGAFYFFFLILQCRPSNYFWTQYTGGKGSCINPHITVIVTYVYSGISCAADWTLGLLPIFLVWNLRMNVRTKIAVALVLALGAVASIATIIRIPYIKDLTNMDDFLYATTDVAIWSLTETGIGITASSFATLRPLFRTFFGRSQNTEETSSQAGPSRWSISKKPLHGYIRSGSNGELEDFELRPDIMKGSGTTTVIENNVDVERSEI